MLRVAVLCTRRAPGLAWLLERDPDRGRVYELEGGVVTDPAGEALPLLRGAGVPTALHDIRAFYAARSARRSDLLVRRAFDQQTLGLLDPWQPDVLVLSGYLHIITAPLLDAFAGRIVNVHDGDVPAWPGLHATRDAMRAGAAATYCTAHLVTDEVDAGPVLARSRPFPVAGRHHYAQRDWMMRDAWGPLISTALGLLARAPALA
jgi:folate-dependent phosphoribosylglycinamide formyltransferase PurN